MRIEAEIKDATHLVLSQPLALPAGRRVLVEIVDEEADTERSDFLAASAALLERAYGPDEPDYSAAGVPL